jgi:hypothetical protein
MFKRKAAVTLLLLLIGLSPASAVAQDNPELIRPNCCDRASAPITGSWIGTTATEGFPPFGYLMTAGRDGTLVLSQAVLVPWPAPGGKAQFSAAHGEWVRIGNNRIAFSFAALIHDENAVPLGISRVQGQLTVANDGKSFNGTGSTVTYDMGGNPMYGFDATLSGTRIQVER